MPFFRCWYLYKESSGLYGGHDPDRRVLALVLTEYGLGAVTVEHHLLSDSHHQTGKKGSSPPTD